ncbi:hypothetical protein COB11_00360 [Candidatus Aerophobetes bacterium]|uniref:Uncharacterized protein n=1 Tax=Aerophobetes bacterium TaxID=2030807 RepID=A0A2A4YNK9_UNCAE|nr:MAG: hypothetical protein COB11_00360 [Candidatus Aerophobetes bacterium]
MTTIVSGQEIDVTPLDFTKQEIDVTPLDFTNELINWLGDKGKYTMEALRDVTFITAHLPRLWGSNEVSELSGASNRLNTAKKFLAFPGALKGSVKLAETLYNGGKSVRNLAGDICYVFGDWVDTFDGARNFGVVTVANVTYNGAMKYIGPLKNACGVYALSNSAYNATVDIAKLREKNLTVVDPKVKDKKTAIEYQKKHVEARIDNKCWDCMRAVCAVAMCSLGLVQASFMLVGGMEAAAAGALIGAPWVFIALSTIGVCGKFMMHAKDQEANFWQRHTAEKMPAA